MFFSTLSGGSNGCRSNQLRIYEVQQLDLFTVSPAAERCAGNRSLPDGFVFLEFREKVLDSAVRTYSAQQPWKINMVDNMLTTRNKKAEGLGSAWQLVASAPT